MIALAPWAGGCRVDKPAAIGVGGQLGRDAPLGIGHGLPVAERAARDGLAVLRFHFPTAHPFAVGTGHQVVIGPRIARPVGVEPAEAREVFRVHGVLIDIIAAGENTQIIESLDLDGWEGVAPEDLADAGGLQFTAE